MAKYTMEMVLEYAKIFPENADMGNADGAAWQKKIADDGGQYLVNAYFTDQAQIDQLIAEGLQENILGNPRIIEGNAEFGIGKYLKLKRPVPDAIKTFDNKGKSVEVNYGGAPGWWIFVTLTTSVTGPLRMMALSVMAQRLWSSLRSTAVVLVSVWST